MSPAQIRQPRIAAYTLHPWEHCQAYLRLVAPWQKAGFELVHATRWDQVSVEAIPGSGLVVLHRDFPRLAQSYQQVMDRARSAGIPVLYDLDDQLLELPPDNAERKYYFASDALFPVLQAIVEADAVTVPTTILQAALLPLNPNTLLLPTCLDESVWTIKPPSVQEKPLPLILAWINDQPDLPLGFIQGIEQILHRHRDNVRLIVWGQQPPGSLLSLANVDWRAELPLNYSGYAAYLSRQASDICIVPHSNHPHYQSQSPLRFLEHSACGLPGVYSRVHPFTGIIQPGENGFLAGVAEEWEGALEKLIGSPALRQQLAQNAQHTLRQDWLLSKNAQRWNEVYTRLSTGSPAQTVDPCARNQVVQAAAQVRQWQRSLETQIRDRDWEVRALNVKLKRKEREASEYIEGLGEYIDSLSEQLQAIWSSPAWRILHKVQRGVEILSSPRQWKAPPPESTPVIQSATSAPEAPPPQGGATQLTGQASPATAYDIIYFCGCDWADLNEEQRRNINNFAEHGCRIFICSPTNVKGESSGLSILQEKVFAVSFPPPVADESGHPLSETDLVKAQLGFFQQLGWDVGIYDAICWIDDPAWAELAYLLRNMYGWKIVRPHQDHARIDGRIALLEQRADVVLAHTPGEMSAYAQFQGFTLDVFPPASIIILTYNNQEVTRQCLESIFAKTTYPHFEVVVVDNASTDGTPEYLRSIAAIHPNIKLLLTQRTGGLLLATTRAHKLPQGISWYF